MIRIRELREAKGMQQKELAIDLGVTQPTISDWESGRKVPSARSTQKLADYFNVSIDYLLGRTQNSAPMDDLLHRKNRIVDVLSERNMTLDELSEKSGIPSKVIWEFATLKKTSGMRDCLYSISDALDLDPAYLIGKAPPAPSGSYWDLCPTEAEWNAAENDPYKAYDCHQAMELERMEDKDEKKPAPDSGDGLSRNVIKIAGRDGSFIERELTDEQISALKLMLDQFPKVGDL